MICLHCEQPIELGNRVFVIPFPTYAEDAFLFAHPECAPDLEGKENALDGFYVAASSRVFVPRQIVEALKAQYREEREEDAPNRESSDLPSEQT